MATRSTPVEHQQVPPSHVVNKNPRYVIKEHCRKHLTSSLNNSMKLLVLNVAGLMSKIKYGLDYHMRSYDVVCLSETKLDSYDDPSLDGFVLHSKIRKSCKRKSGGIAIYVKSSLAKYFKTPAIASSEFVIWLTVNKEYLGFDFVLGAVYIPPEGSPYSSHDAFENIEDDIINLCNNFTAPVCLVGDFNARSGTLPDFVNVDEHMLNFVDIDNNVRSFIQGHDRLQKIGFDKNRYSCDNVIDNYGRRLTEMCQNVNIHIANGRLGDDKGVGKLTCKNVSLVDYVLLSPELFPLVSHFNVEQFDELHSDVHNSITVSFKAGNTMTAGTDDADNVNINAQGMLKSDTVRHQISIASRPKWNAQVNLKLKNNLDFSALKQINIEIDSTANTKSATKEHVNKIVDSICSILKDAVADSDTQTQKPNNVKYKSKQPSKPWFNKSCKEKRSQYFKAKRHYRYNQTDENRCKLILASKAYKKIINSQYKLHYNELNQKLKSLKSNNPKEFWNIINEEEYNLQKKQDNIDITTFADHFKQMNVQNPNDKFTFNVNDIPNNNSEINNPFTETEVEKEIKNLKINKACGTDRMLNEYFKNAPQALVSTVTKLFNLVLDSGIVPSTWTIGLIQPLYKNKGSINDPDNYRGITILSCFGKLFTGLLNTRITKYLDKHKKIGEEQAGFRSKYSTMDHIFLLKSTIDLYLQKRKRLYCAFIDYKKAFDTVCRNALWQKVVSNGIDGKLFTVIYNLYQEAKSGVKHHSQLSDFFQCNMGVRQGENLSPILFAMYLNDLESTISRNCKGLSSISKLLEQNLPDEDTEVYLKLHLLLYADDTVLMAESADDLQTALDNMAEYCKYWQLQVNTTKTKIVIFSRGKVQKKKHIYLQRNHS